MIFLQRLKDYFFQPKQLRQMGLLARIRNILRKPQHFLVILAFEDASILSICQNYLLILAAIPALCGLIGMRVFGVGGLFSASPVPFLFAVLMALICYVLTVLMVFLLAFAINALTVRCDGQKDFLAAFKLATYASTPALLGGVFGLVPALSLLSLVCTLYGARLVRMGLPILMKVSHEKTERHAKFLPPLTLTAGAALFFCLILTSSLFGENAKQLNRESDAYIVLENYQKPEAPAPTVKKPTAPPAQVLQRIHHPPLSPEVLAGFLPKTLGPFSRTALQNSSLSGDTPVSVSLANYDSGGHQKLIITLLDTGDVLDGALPADKETDTQVEKRWRKQGRIYLLKYDKPGPRAEYRIVLRNGVTVTLEGTRISSELLKALSLKLDLAVLENLSRH